MSKTKIFISYSHRDVGVAEKVAHALTQVKRPPIVAPLLPQAVRAGGEFREVIRRNP